MDRLQQLTVFRRVVETGNITRAARDLAMSQPNVSRIVAELETRLGVPLLLRSPRGLAPTEAGHAFYSDAIRVLDALEEAETHVRGNQNGLSGPVRITASAPLFNRIVMPWLPDFLAEHPALEFEARLDSRLVDLVEEGIDLAIRVGEIADQSMIQRRLGRLEIALFAAPDHLARNGAPETPEELAAHPFCVTLASRMPVTMRLEGPEDQVAEVVVPVRFRSTDVEAITLAAIAGCGIGVLPEWSATPAVEEGRLVRVLPRWRAEAKDVHAVWPGTRALPRRVRAFLDRLVERCAENPKLRAP